MFDAQGDRRKLIIFTEHRDTLEYLVERLTLGAQLRHHRHPACSHALGAGLAPHPQLDDAAVQRVHVQVGQPVRPLESQLAELQAADAGADQQPHRQPLLGQPRVAGGQDVAQLSQVGERRPLPRHPHLGQRQDAFGDGYPSVDAQRKNVRSARSEPLSVSGWIGLPRRPGREARSARHCRTTTTSSSSNRRISGCSQRTQRRKRPIVCSYNRSVAGDTGRPCRSRRKCAYASSRGVTRRSATRP